jgi:5-methylthioribose kinase
MFELTADNAPDYLRERGVVGPLRVERLSGGVSNEVLRVATPQRRFVLKQSRPRLRTRDAWFSDLNRVEREWEVMRALAPVLPDVVPDVLFVDRPNYAYAMSHAPDDAVVWKSQLLAGQIDAALGERVGRVLGVMHEQSVRNAAAFAGFTDHTVYVQLRVDPFYRRIQERRPEVAAEVGRIIDGMLARREALCHGDYTPKNMLVHAGGFTLVDYETAHVGDPTMDLGLFLAHVLLKALRLPSRRAGYLALADAFWRGYAGAVTYRPADELARRGVRHLGVCLLARIDGTSPVDYLPEEPKRETIRRLGRAILLYGLGRWDDVRAWCDRGFAPFADAEAP